MRYDTQLKLMTLTTMEDGQGGYTEVLDVDKILYCHKSDMNMELSEKLFGKVSITAIHCVVNEILNLKNNADTTFYIDDRKYGLVRYKIFRNKTHLYLEVMDNE